MLRVSELERHEPAEAVAHHNWTADLELRAQPRHVVGETGHRVGLLGRFALAVTAQVDSEDAVTTREMLNLRCPEPTVARDSVHEHEWRIPFSDLLIGKRYAVADQVRHAVSVHGLLSDARCCCDPGSLQRRPDLLQGAQPVA